MEQARQNLEARVLERAAKDPQFREQLKQDPRGTVAREFGVQVPPDITVQVVEATPSRVYLVLPPVSGQPGQELADQELEAVAGGGWTAATNVGCGSCEEGCTFTRRTCPAWDSCSIHSRGILRGEQGLAWDAREAKWEHVAEGCLRE